MDKNIGIAAEARFIFSCPRLLPHLPETYFQADESLGSGPLADIDRTTIDTFLFPLGKGKVLPHRRIDLVDRLSVCKVRTQEAENFDEEVKS